MSEEETPKIGRPTKYKPEYCEEIIRFFDVKPFDTINVVTTWKSGEKKEEKRIASELPTFERFAHNIGVVRDTLHEWCKMHPEFSDAYARAKQLQKDILIQGGLLGVYNPQFAVFLAPNETDLRDRREITGADGKPIEIAHYTPQDRLELEQVMALMVELQQKKVGYEEVIDVVPGPGSTEKSET